MNHKPYSNRVRVRSCGLLVRDQKLLLLELLSPLTNEWVWLPPGGEVEFGESIEKALEREFKEETGLNISVKQRIHINEVISPPIHAIEFYHIVKNVGGELSLGTDPELEKDQQIIRDIGFFSVQEMQQLKVPLPFLEDEFSKLLRK